MQKFIMHESEARASHQVARRSVEEIVEIRWLTGCQGLIGECGDF